MLAAEPPIKYRARARDLMANELWIIAIHVEVMNHPNPKQREGRNHLHERRWIPALGEPVRNARVIERFNGLATKTIVAGDSVRDERLQASVADVLQALPVRRVHV